MSEPKWALLDHAHIDEVVFPWMEGFFLIARTNTPCHLWARVSRNLPDKHYIAQERRGLTTMKATYRCFNVYEDIEQLEAGDTLIHKFHLKALEYKKPVYFFYWGTVAGLASPSETCIFQLTRKYRLGKLYEIYNPGARRALTFSYYRPQAQTFTPTATYDITAVRLAGSYFNTGHKVIVEIRTTFPDGSPGAHVLSQTTYPNMPPDWIAAGWAENYLTLPKTRVVAGTKVCICLWGDPDFPNELQGQWGRDNFGDNYPDGDAFNGYFDPPNAYWKSCPYPGGPWFDDYDQRFAVYGLPPGA